MRTPRFLRLARGWRPLALLCASQLSGCVVLTGSGETVVPQRPTFSSDTGTVAEGTLELEAGFAVDPGDALAVPVALKYGLDDATELFLGLGAYQMLDLPGEDADGLGDTILGVRHRFHAGGRGTSAAAQAIVKLPTADEDEGLGTGELDAFLAGIATQQTGEATFVTIFYELGLLGDPEGSGEDVQHAVAIAAAHALHDELSIFGEVVEVFTPDDLDPVLGTLGATWYPVPHLALDAGVVVGLDDDAADFQLVFGLTTNLGRIGRGRTGPGS